jgi:capsular exopolysaccharide synthesis family protein
MTADEAAPEFELGRYIRIVSRRKWWIIGITVLGVLAATVYAFTAQKQYTATALLQVEPARGSIIVNGPTPTVAPTDVSTQLQLLTSSAVENTVAASLHFRPSITGSQVGATDVLSIKATSSDPVQAARVANTYAKEFVSFEREVSVKNLTSEELQYQQQIAAIDTQLQGLTTNSPGAVALGNQEALLKQDLAQLQIAGASTGGGVQFVSPASVPQQPSSPKKGLDILLGALVGLILGLLVAGLLEHLDDTVYDQADLERLSPGIPILGQVPMIGTWKDKKSTVLISVSDPNSVVTEAYRSLRTSLQFVSYDDPVRVILVSSPNATDGKTSTVSNLGVMFAAAGQSVVLVSADLRRPRLAQFFGMDERVGLTSVVIGAATLDEALQPVPGLPGMTLLGSGPIPPNPSELLGSKVTADLMAQLRARFDVVLIDSPPLLPVTDPVILTRLADFTILIVGAGQTKKSQLARAFKQFAQSGLPRLGIVFNEVRRDSDNTYSYSQSYSYKTRSSLEQPAPLASADKERNGPAHARSKLAAEEPKVTAEDVPID